MNSCVIFSLCQILAE